MSVTLRYALHCISRFVFLPIVATITGGARWMPVTPEEWELRNGIRI